MQVAGELPAKEESFKVLEPSIHGDDPPYRAPTCFSFAFRTWFAAPSPKLGRGLGRGLNRAGDEDHSGQGQAMRKMCTHSSLIEGFWVAAEKAWSALEWGMIADSVRYLIDEDGRKVAVVLDIEAYHRLLAELEELESLRAFDEAKAEGGEATPIEEALAEIERGR
jgi:hypothetical protein